ncbi:hypothetical protein M408DRAFT_330548 [Serendipita vermifera MAFF 305830]|uniref:Uncharacterized protein n=1 Tax=Serendipita vermifera MAFF 305830 TaxID=933852 RepID=A0A0C2WJY0_SERVB|nr:hypothetical protein M408DRAFT_330548 [Serendipita vermifera MAFF 305830]
MGIHVDGRASQRLDACRELGKRLVYRPTKTRLDRDYADLASLANLSENWKD